MGREREAERLVRSQVDTRTLNGDAFLDFLVGRQRGGHDGPDVTPGKVRARQDVLGARKRPEPRADRRPSLLDIGCLPKCPGGDSLHHREGILHPMREFVVEELLVLLRGLAVRDVGGRSHPAPDVPALVEERHGTGQRPALAAVDPIHLVFDMIGVPRGDRAPDLGPHETAMVLGDVLFQPVHVA